MVKTNQIHISQFGRNLPEIGKEGNYQKELLNPNQSGRFGQSIERGGGVECAHRPFRAITPLFFIRNQPNMVSNESWHLYLPLEPLNTFLSCIVLS